MNLRDIFYLLPCVFEEKLIKKFHWLPGNPILSIQYKNLHRGLVKERKKNNKNKKPKNGHFKNSATVYLCDNHKVINAKLSKNKIHMCGIKSEEGGRESAQILVRILENVQSLIKDIRSLSLERKTQIYEELSNITKGDEFSYQISEIKVFSNNLKMNIIRNMKDFTIKKTDLAFDDPIMSYLYGLRIGIDRFTIFEGKIKKLLFGECDLYSGVDQIKIEKFDLVMINHNYHFKMVNDEGKLERISFDLIQLNETIINYGPKFFGDEYYKIISNYDNTVDIYLGVQVIDKQYKKKHALMIYGAGSATLSNKNTASREDIIKFYTMFNKFIVDNYELVREKKD